MKEEDQQLWERYGIRPADASKPTVKTIRDVLLKPKRLVIAVLLAVSLWVVLEMGSAVVLTLVFSSGHELPEGLLMAGSPTWLILMAALAFWLALRLVRAWLERSASADAA